MSSDVHYVCQRAANAIISELGPYRVSTDALTAINQFLDSFILLLSTRSLNLSTIKSVVTVLLPSTLGNNAIIEAEIEAKSFAKVETIDYSIGTLVQSPYSLLRKKCLEYCTLNDKEELVQHVDDSSIPPIMGIYVTTIIEHIAEHILIKVVNVAENDHTDFIRVKQVFLSLQNDPQLSSVFDKMDLKEKLQKRVGNMATTAAAPPPLPIETSLFSDFELDLEYFDDVQSIISSKEKVQPQQLPPPLPKNRKSTFYLFKETPSKLPMMNFEDLFKSGETVKVSLTPKRLKSIEVTARHTTTSLPTSNSKKQIFAKKALSLSLPIKKFSSSRNSASSHQRDTQDMQHVHQQQQQLDIPQTPSSIFSYTTRETSTQRSSVETVLRSSSSQHSKIPMDIPNYYMPTPLEASLTISPTIHNVNTTIPSSYSTMPRNSLNAPSTISLTTSPSSSDITTPSSLQSIPKISAAGSSDIRLLQEQPTPSKPNTTIVLRRSSVSSRKSRENLRKLKEQQQEQTEPIPTTSFCSNTRIDEPERFDTNEPSPDHGTTLTDETVSKEKASLPLVRPSSVVAKRLSMSDDGHRRSYHEQYAVEKYNHPHSVSVAIKQWDELHVTEEATVGSPPSRRTDLQRTKNAVLDKVLKLEQSIHGQHQLSKEKFVYLQQNPSAIVAEKKKKKKVVKEFTRRVESVDRAVQTDTTSADDISEHGRIEGDEEWFLNDYEWEEQDETAMVEWLLGE